LTDRFRFQIRGSSNMLLLMLLICMLPVSSHLHSPGNAALPLSAPHDPNPHIEPSFVLHLRGGWREEAKLGGPRATPASSSSKVTFGDRRPGKESDESWLEHSRSRGAPDGKHTPAKPSSSQRRKRAIAVSSSDGEDSVEVGQESSKRFAQLGAPDGKHTPAASRYVLL
jgi:hypothetical protein